MSMPFAPPADCTTIDGVRRILSGIAGMLAAVALVVLAASAVAALPKPVNATIKNFGPIGGVGIGTSRARLVDVWGPPLDARGKKACYNPDAPDYADEICVWQPSGGTDLPPEGGYVELLNGKVCEVMIQAGYTPGNWVLHTTKLRKQKWHTKEGVGLESSKRAAKRAFRGTTLSGDTLLSGDRDGVREQISMMFTGPDKGKVQQIRLVKKGTPCFRN
jgi:hypothetical protein